MPSTTCIELVAPINVLGLLSGVDWSRDGNRNIMYRVNLAHARTSSRNEARWICDPFPQMRLVLLPWKARVVNHNFGWSAAHNVAELWHALSADLIADMAHILNLAGCHLGHGYQAPLEQKLFEIEQDP